MKRFYAKFYRDNSWAKQHVILAAESLGYEWHLAGAYGLVVIAPESFWDVMYNNADTIPEMTDI